MTLRDHPLRVLVLLPLSLLLRADVCWEEPFGVLPFPSTGETTTTKKVTLRLGPTQPTQRFRLPLSMTPPSSSAHLDVTVANTTQAVGLEIANEGADSSDPRDWPTVSTGFAGSVFLEVSEQQNAVLSVGLQSDDPGVGADVDLDLVLAAPDDVDFDGQSDGVVVDIGRLEPLP